MENIEATRSQIAARGVREKISTTIDLPLSDESKRVLKQAADEADRLAHRHIGTEHLLLGLAREEKCFAAELPRAHLIPNRRQILLALPLRQCYLCCFW